MQTKKKKLNTRAYKGRKMNRTISGNKSNPSSLLLSNRKKSIIKKIPTNATIQIRVSRNTGFNSFFNFIENDMNIQNYEKYGKMAFN